MHSLFNMENPFWGGINKIIDVVSLSIVWTLCCVPIVTIGPACSALYYAVVKTVRKERGYAIKEFFKAFRGNLKKGMIIWLIMSVFSTAMIISDVPMILSLINQTETSNVLYLVIFVLKAWVLVGLSNWIYPLLSRFEEKVVKLMEAALYLFFRNFFKTSICVVFTVVAAVAVILEPLLLAVVPGAVTLMLSFFVETGLGKLYREGEEAKQEDLWYQ